MSANQLISIQLISMASASCLSEPVELDRDARLIVTVLPKGDTERDAWLRTVIERA
jgi:hypothetical protein